MRVRTMDFDTYMESENNYWSTWILLISISFFTNSRVSFKRLCTYNRIAEGYEDPHLTPYKCQQKMFISKSHQNCTLELQQVWVKFPQLQQYSYNYYPNSFKKKKKKTKTQLLFIMLFNFKKRICSVITKYTRHNLTCIPYSKSPVNPLLETQHRKNHQ